MAKKELPVLGASGRKRPNYNCAKCPGYCCTYTWIKVNRRDITRLAKRFNLEFEVAQRRFTRYEPDFGHHILRHREDTVFQSICRFFDQENRQCGIYEHRPELCRNWPTDNHCGFYDFLQWERKHQDDETFVPFRRD